MTGRFNLHNHSTWSDGAASARDLVEAAAQDGLSHFGLSDHYVSSKLPEGKALTLEQIPDYVEELRSLRAQLGDRIKVLAGLEVNFSLVQTDFTFLGRFEPAKNPLNALDYVLFEYVNDGEWFGLGLEELLKVRSILQVPIGLAHNDLARNFGGVLQPEGLAKILAQSQVFVELCPTRRNSLPAADGHTPYYRARSEFNRRFFAAARKEGLLFSIGCDVHADLREVGEVDDARRFLDEHGLGGQTVIEHYWSERG